MREGVVGIDANQLTSLLRVGGGAIATVYRATYGGNPVAVKLYDPYAEKQTLETEQRVRLNGEELVRGTRDYEVAIMNLLCGIPNVAGLHGVINDFTLNEKGIWVPERGIHGLVREYAKGLPLSKCGAEFWSNYELSDKVFEQYVQAMTQAAERGVSFGDIKPDDVIVDASKQEIRIVDLNLADFVPESERCETFWSDVKAVSLKLIPKSYSISEGKLQPVFYAGPLGNYDGPKFISEREYSRPRIDSNVAYNMIVMNLVLSRGELHGATKNLGTQRRTEAKKTLNTSSPESFVMSLMATGAYKNLLDDMAGYRVAIGKSRSALWVDSQLMGSLESEFGDMGINFRDPKWRPHKLAELVANLYKT